MRNRQTMKHIIIWNENIWSVLEWIKQNFHIRTQAIRLLMYVKSIEWMIFFFFDFQLIMQAEAICLSYLVFRYADAKSEWIIEKRKKRIDKTTFYQLFYLNMNICWVLSAGWLVFVCWLKFSSFETNVGVDIENWVKSHLL